jgi:hypothetical protein
VIEGNPELATQLNDKLFDAMAKASDEEHKAWLAKLDAEKQTAEPAAVAAKTEPTPKKKG